MKVRLVVGVLGVALFVGGGGRAAAEFYTITDLGNTVPGQLIIPTGLNDRGQVVGYLGGNVGATRSFLYSNGRLVDLGLAPGSVPAAINSSGQIAGSYEGDLHSNHAFLYSGGQVTDLGTLGGAFSYARGLNDSGQVVGSSFTNTSSSQVPYVFSNGKMTALGIPETYGYAVAINASGQIIGSTAQALGSLAQATFLYSAGQTTSLPLSGVTAMNNSGQVVGSAQGVPFIYSNGSAYTLGTLPGYGYGTAIGINDSAHVVGNLSASPVFGAATQPFFWTGGAPVPLQSLLPPDSGWQLLHVTAINNPGQIVGWGYNPQGVESTFLMTPPAEAPEPGTLALLGIGAGSLAGYSWRKRQRLTPPLVTRRLPRVPDRCERATTT